MDRTINILNIVFKRVESRMKSLTEHCKSILEELPDNMGLPFAGGWLLSKAAFFKINRPVFLNEAPLIFNYWILLAKGCMIGIKNEECLADFLRSSK